MPSFGEKLKHEREKRKITLEQISASTKIGTRLLQALEEDKFNQLPGGIFNKGFVRAYSRIIGLDEDQTVAEYLQASGDAPPVSTEIVARDDETRENQKTITRLEAISDATARQLPWGMFAALLLLLALALALWSRHQREHGRQSPAPTPINSVKPLPAAQSSVEVSGATLDQKPTVDNASIVTSSASGALTVAAPPAGATPVSGTAGEFTVSIHAREESWISIVADGKVSPSEVLAPGSERTVHGRKEIIVKAGNSGGLDVSLDGRKLGTGGEHGEVKTLAIGPQGILSKAPAPPSTP